MRPVTAFSGEPLNDEVLALGVAEPSQFCEERPPCRRTRLRRSRVLTGEMGDCDAARATTLLRTSYRGQHDALPISPMTSAASLDHLIRTRGAWAGSQAPGLWLSWH